MSDELGSGLINWLDALVGGAATTVITAITMRVIYHSQQVRSHRRPLFGWELVFEAPIAVGMALVGDSLATYLGLSHHASIGVVAALSWLGPRGAQALLDRWIASKIGDEK